MTDRERIKQLHKQAFDWVQYQLQTVGSYHSVMQSELLEMVNEKFAELIVQECNSTRLEQPEPVIQARKEGDLIVADLPQVPRGSGGISKEEL